MQGQRVSYRFRGQVRRGTILGREGEAYLVLNDASDLIHRVLPQWIVNQ